MGFIDRTYVRPLFMCCPNNGKYDELQETYDKMDRRNILSKDILLDVKDAFTVVSREESHREAHKSASASTGSTSFDTLYTKDQMMKTLSLINEKPSGSASANMAVIGNLRLTDSVVLFDVLVVPEYCVSPFFVHKLITDNISYVVHCLSQHMNSPLKSHFTAALRVLSKKQATLSRSSAEAEYRCMASITCEAVWLINLLNDLNVEGLVPVLLYCGGTSVIQIAANLVFHEKTKHFENDVHLV
ncbi:ribonuclease H-like domain-containing protein [Tanacetum coccineum]